MSEQRPNAAALASFCAVAIAWIGQEKWKRRSKLRGRHSSHHSLLGSAGSNSNDDTLMISERGNSLLTPTLPYIYDYLKCLQDQCDPYTNPQVCS